VPALPGNQETLTNTLKDDFEDR